MIKIWEVDSKARAQHFSFRSSQTGRELDFVDIQGRLTNDAWKCYWKLKPGNEFDTRLTDGQEVIIESTK